MVVLMTRRQILYNLLGSSCGLPAFLVATAPGVSAQGRGCFTFYNYTHSKLRVYMNYSEQNPMEAGEYQSFHLDLGDHKFEAYLGQSYYGHSFRLTRTTPTRDLTLQDGDFS